jgi:HD superfamily phosphohydrolase
MIISQLNKEMDGRLSMGLDIFNGHYKKKFLNELVSSQLDIDRLDYLKRDSFFTGVSEGTIGADRIIKMLNVQNDRLVVEEKGIYSIENFLSARRLMYWQVYLHKASVSAEKMLINIIQRARKLTRKGDTLYASKPLTLFLSRDIGIENFAEEPGVLDSFAQMDDYDIWGAIKVWADHEDRILSVLCKMLLNRRLFRIKLTNEAPSKTEIKALEASIMKKYDLKPSEVKYFFSHGKVTNNAYKVSDREILILSKSGAVRDVVEAADLPNIKAMSKIVRKYYRCWPKDISL